VQQLPGGSIVSDPVAQLALCAWLKKQIRTWEAEAKAALAMLPGERMAASIDKKPLGFVTLAHGKRSTHVDDDAFTEWVEQRYPTEITKAVRPAFRSKLLAQALSRGALIDDDGEVCDAVMVSRGDPYPTTQLSDEADITVSALLSKGQLGINGLRTLGPKPEPIDRYTQDHIASGVADE